jgi:hypothetical protein
LVLHIFRACVNIDHVPDIAKAVLNCKEYTDVKDSVAAILIDMKNEQRIRTENITKLAEQKDKLLDTVDKYQDDVIKQVKRMADTTRQEIRTEFEAEKTVITADIESLDILIPTIETSLQKLSITNEAQLFVNMKASKLTVNDGKSVLSDLSSSWTTKRLTYTFDESLRSTVASMKSFGTLGYKENVQEFEAKLYGKFNVKQSTDTSTFTITGICPLMDGSIVIIDYYNKKLKQLNSNYKVKDTLAVNGNPIGICDVSSNEVAVNLYSTGQIQFISVKDSMRLTSSIQVDKSCYGIYYNERSDELFACCGSNISVFDKRGSLLRVLNTDPNGEQLFSSLRQVIVTDSRNEIVVTDENKGLISVNPQGKVNWFIKNRELSSAWGLCVASGGILFVSGYISHNIIQVDKNGNKKGVLLGTSDGLCNPYSIAFDSQRSRLIVGMTSNDIHVFTLSAKT